jgi:transposase
MSRSCPACSARLDQQATTCPHCGADLNADRANQEGTQGRYQVS